jgi:predicted amidophosphoribosyltransferase
MRFENEQPLGGKPEIVPVKSEDCDCEDGGVMVCSNCAEPIDFSISHCPSCGKKLKT